MKFFAPASEFCVLDKSRKNRLQGTICCSAFCGALLALWWPQLSDGVKSLLRPRQRSSFALFLVWRHWQLCTLPASAKNSSSLLESQKVKSSDKARWLNVTSAANWFILVSLEVWKQNAALCWKGNGLVQQESVSNFDPSGFDCRNGNRWQIILTRRSSSGKIFPCDVFLWYFAAEQRNSLGKVWHPGCLRCEECGKRLNPGQHSEVYYCVNLNFNERSA